MSFLCKDITFSTIPKRLHTYPAQILLKKPSQTKNSSVAIVIFVNPGILL